MPVRGEGGGLGIGSAWGGEYGALPEGSLPKSAQVAVLGREAASAALP